MVTISVVNMVLKPGPTRRVDPGPGRPGHGTGPGLSKNSPGNWPGETRGPAGQPGTRPTRVNPAETRPLFFLICIKVTRRRFG
jgi:hypothetical protein